MYHSSAHTDFGLKLFRSGTNNNLAVYGIVSGYLVFRYLRIYSLYVIVLFIEPEHVSYININDRIDKQQQEYFVISPNKKRWIKILNYFDSWLKITFSIQYQDPQFNNSQMKMIVVIVAKGVRNALLSAKSDNMQQKNIFFGRMNSIVWIKCETNSYPKTQTMLTTYGWFSWVNCVII